METLYESATLMLRQFRALLRLSPLPINCSRLLQLIALNMFAIESAQLKGNGCISNFIMCFQVVKDCNIYFCRDPNLIGVVDDSNFGNNISLVVLTSEFDLFVGIFKLLTPLWFSDAFCLFRRKIVHVSSFYLCTEVHCLPDKIYELF